jgi:putative transposase
LTHILAGRPELAAFGTVVSRGTLRRLERAYAAFYRRVAAGQTPGFPRYRSFRRFDSVSYEDRSGWKLDPATGRLHLLGVGHVRVRVHRPIPDGARLRACVVRRERVVRRAGHPTRARWTATIAVELPAAAPLPATGRRCGVDVGVRVLAAVVDDRGRATLVANPRPLAAAATRLQVAQQRLSRAQPRSHRRERARAAVAVAHAKVARVRAWHTHQLSHDLVRDHDLIAVEDLKVTNMTRSASGTVGCPGVNVAAKAGLNRVILDAGWAQLRRQVSYKAANAGRELVAVPPQRTSQTCHHCGHTDPASRHGAVFDCTACGHHADADINAAANILQRAESTRQPPAA